MLQRMKKGVAFIFLIGLLFSNILPLIPAKNSSIGLDQNIKFNTYIAGDELIDPGIMIIKG